MNLLDFLRPNGKKEYMKYEDGKIIPVKVEEHRNPNEIKISPAEQKEEIKNAIKEKVDMPGKVKRYGTFKTLKIIGAIAVVIFFGYAVKDVYTAFTNDSPPPISESPSGQEPPANDLPNPLPDTPSTNGSFTTGGDHLDDVIPPKEEEQPLQQGEVDMDASPLKRAIDATNVVNGMMLSEMVKEIGGLNDHFDNKMNKFTFEKRLNGSLETKQQLQTHLLTNKSIFQKEKIMNFYSVTEKRLKNSREMTEFILGSFTNSTTNTEVAEEVERFVAEEFKLKEEQKKVFIQLLKDKGIKYQVDDVNEEITYTLE